MMHMYVDVMPVCCTNLCNPFCLCRSLPFHLLNTLVALVHPRLQLCLPLANSRFLLCCHSLSSVRRRYSSLTSLSAHAGDDGLCDFVNFPHGDCWYRKPKVPHLLTENGTQDGTSPSDVDAAEQFSGRAMNQFTKLTYPRSILSIPLHPDPVQ